MDASDNKIWRVIGPVVYTDGPENVHDIFAHSPQTGIVVVTTELPDEVRQELPRIHELARRHSSLHQFNAACQNTELWAWAEGEVQALGNNYPTFNVYRTNDIGRISWHVDLMQGRRRCFIQLDGEGLRMASPETPLRILFDNARNSQPFCPPDTDADDNLRNQSLILSTLKQGQMAVFGDYGLHAPALGSKLRAIAY